MQSSHTVGRAQWRGSSRADLAAVHKGLQTCGYEKGQPPSFPRKNREQAHLLERQEQARPVHPSRSHADARRKLRHREPRVVPTKALEERPAAAAATEEVKVGQAATAKQAAVPLEVEIGEEVEMAAAVKAVVAAAAASQ